jgi:hypothetical protein
MKRKQKNKPRVQLHFRLPEAMAANLKKTSIKTGLTQTKIIEKALVIVLTQKGML